ncbi:MAG: hypothetical protein JW768_06715 [Chitinispirillaceae bacterium]|nr:hypothetical protein [Chitinispirillaceae bacterium]
MCRRLLFCLIMFAAATVNVQTANADISGKVANQAGKGIANATLTLAVKKTTATTGSDGSFTLATTGTAFTLLQPQSTTITLNRDVINFSLANPSPVKVEIFDVKGNVLKKEVLQNAQPGFYRFNIAENCRTTNLLVVHASIGKREMTFRYLPLNNGKQTVNSSVETSVPAGGTLAKIAAVIDTLKVTATNYTEKKVAITSYDTTVNVTLDTVDDNSLAVRLDQEKQTIQGFGINACLMTGSIFNIDECFGLNGNDALGMSILRIGMDVGGGHRGVPSGWERARTQYNAKIIGSCWSAQGGWKSNGQEDGGGYLKKEYYTQWAELIAKYAKNNNLYAMSIANESDFASCGGGSGKACNPPLTNAYASMTYTGKQMAEFVKEARKAFDKICPDVKLIAPEASLWIHVWSNLSGKDKYNSSDPHGCGCFANDITEEAEAKCAEKCKNGEGYDYGHWLAKDEEAWKAIDILGVHEYETQKAHAWPADVTGGVRTKEVWQTEMSGVMYWPEQGPTTDINNGVAVARWIQSALTIGEASAWLYWWYGPPYYDWDDNEGLALVKGKSQKTKRYYTFGNYSRYIRPGQKVVNITGTDKLPAKVLLTASKADDGTVVIVAVNETTSAQSVPIKIAGGTAPASFKPIVTAESYNWKEGSAVSVADGVLTMQLEKMSVTTFVSQ